MSEPFDVVRHPTARRIRLSLDPASGRARLVVPRRAALKPALAWAQGKAEWIAEQRARLPQPRDDRRDPAAPPRQPLSRDERRDGGPAGRPPLQRPLQDDRPTQ